MTPWSDVSEYSIILQSCWRAVLGAKTRQRLRSSQTIFGPRVMIPHKEHRKYLGSDSDHIRKYIS